VSEQENIAALRRLIELGFSQGDLTILDELMSPTVVEHQRGNGPGIEGARAVVATLHRWFSDFGMTVLEVAADGDKVWSLNRARGVNTGSIMGNPPTGKRMEVDVIDIVRFESGRIVEHWGIADQLGMLIQLDLLHRPTPASVA
jgi:predicted ester cyclase